MEKKTKGILVVGGAAAAILFLMTRDDAAGFGGGFGGGAYGEGVGAVGEAVAAAVGGVTGDAGEVIPDKKVMDEPSDYAEDVYGPIRDWVSGGEYTPTPYAIPGTTEKKAFTEAVRVTPEGKGLFATLEEDPLLKGWASLVDGMGALVGREPTYTKERLARVPGRPTVTAVPKVSTNMTARVTDKVPISTKKVTSYADYSSLSRAGKAAAGYSYMRPSKVGPKDIVKTLKPGWQQIGAKKPTRPGQPDVY